MSNMTTLKTIPPPKSLEKPLNVPSKILMGPGPSNCPPRVMHALGLPILSHLDKEMLQIMDEVKDGIRYVFQTENDLTLCVSASGHGGMEAVFCNLLEDGDTVVVAINGIWGERAFNMAQRYGATAIALTSTIGDNFTLARIEQTIAKYRPRLFFITQGESSTGVYQNIEGIGDICRRYDTLLAVDTVASLGSVPFFMDLWHVDCVYTGSQKVLASPAGLAPISFSARAQKRIFERKTQVKVFYWDMKQLGAYWNCFGNGRIYHHTVSSQLIYGLREGLAIVAEEGLENVISRHEKCAKILYNGLQDLGLRLFVQDGNKRLPTVTTIVVPENVDWRDVTAYAMNKYKLEISGGLGPTANRVFRIGLMGYNANVHNVELVLRVLKDSLQHARKAKHSKL